jgi:hypothetical protein
MERIGRELRKTYQALIEEPLPDRVMAAFHRFEDAQSGLVQLRKAAEAMRRADDVKGGRSQRAAEAGHGSPVQKSAKGR